GPGLDVVEEIMPIQLGAQPHDLALDLLARHDRSPPSSRATARRALWPTQPVCIPLAPAGSPHHTGQRHSRTARSARSSPFLDLVRGENQESVTIARIPASSMTTNSMPRARGPLRSSQAARTSEPAPRGGRAGFGAST